MTLFIDGRKVGTLPSIDFTASYKHTYLEVDISNLDKISGGIDVRIQDIVIARHIPLMENLSFDDIKGSNVGVDPECGPLLGAEKTSRRREGKSREGL